MFLHVFTAHPSGMEATSAEQPSAGSEQEEQGDHDHVKSGEETTANQQHPSGQNSNKEDAIVIEPSSGQETQQQQIETVKGNQVCSESEKHDQHDDHSAEEKVSADEKEPDESKLPLSPEEQQPEEHMDDNPPSLEQQNQEEQESQYTEMRQHDRTEQDAVPTAAVAEEYMELATGVDDNNKEDEVAMETNVEQPQSTPGTNQPSDEVIDNEPPCTVADDIQQELTPTNKDSQSESEKLKPEADSEMAEEEAEPQKETRSKEKCGNTELKVAEQITDEEAPKTDATSVEEKIAEVNESEQITEEEQPTEDQQPVKDRVAAESFTLELDEDPLGNSSIFMEDEPRNEVLVDPDISPPVSKKRKGKPRKLGTRTARSKVFLYY